MQASSIQLANISQKPCKTRISNAVGLLLISPQSFANFIADCMHKQYINIAIADGLRAAKMTSEVFALCHQINLQHIDITIQPTDSIHTDTLQYYTNTLPTFTRKHFQVTINNKKEKSAEKIDKKPSMRTRFNQAALQFRAMQLIKNIDTDVAKAQGHCGFEIRVSIQTNDKIQPNIESMYALHATLLSLFSKFSHDDMAVIAQMRLIE